MSFGNWKSFAVGELERDGGADASGADDLAVVAVAELEGVEHVRFYVKFC